MISEAAIRAINHGSAVTERSAATATPVVVVTPSSSSMDLYSHPPEDMVQILMQPGPGPSQRRTGVVVISASQQDGSFDESVHSALDVSRRQPGPAPTQGVIVVVVCVMQPDTHGAQKVVVVTAGAAVGQPLGPAGLPSGQDGVAPTAVEVVVGPTTKRSVLTHQFRVFRCWTNLFSAIFAVSRSRMLPSPVGGSPASTRTIIGANPLPGAAETW
mmetsp:Transcript_73849/g.193695  ORF Transcript_73849/g.193695 Transcript_73849/m.193695 type:complete len:215 (-) Transcript_73849:727-1371(-)